MFYPARALSTAVLSLVVLAMVVSGQTDVQAAGPVLYGVSGEGGANPETLFRINHETGSTQFLTRLGNGGDGEEIAYNPESGWLLHASGRVIGEDMILEWVYPATGAVTPIKVSGDQCDEVTALTYAGGGSFLAGTVDGFLCSISSAGVVKKIATLDPENVATGLAFVNGKLYLTGWGNRTDLRTVDPGTGATISIIELKVDSTDYRLTALASHPCTGELYAAMAVGATEIRTPTTRSLVKIDPSSGRVTVIKDLGESFAGLAFVGSDCQQASARPNAGGAIGSLQTAQATQANLERAAAAPLVPALPAAPAAVTAPTVVVRPPNTGDGGLLLDD